MPSSILNSDDGVISGTSGLKSTGGDDAVLLIQTKGVTAQTVDAGQRTKFPTTIGVGGATPSTSGSGITFPATQSASTDANTLDDYEEGTWTPTDASGAGLTLTVTGASYVKIGKQVTAWLWVTYPSTANGSAAVIGGLPFNVGASPMNGVAISSYTTYTEVVTGLAVYTTQSIELYRDGGTSVTNTNLSTKELRMGLIYTV